MKYVKYYEDNEYLYNVSDYVKCKVVRPDVNDIVEIVSVHDSKHTAFSILTLDLNTCEFREFTTNIDNIERLATQDEIDNIGVLINANKYNI